MSICASLITNGLALLLIAGCSSTTQIQTAPPRTGQPISIDTTATSDLARIQVMVETGETSLPEAIQAMQFRIDEVHFKSTKGDWIAFPADINSFEITAGSAARKTVLSTQILPARYDSLALFLSDIFVFFDANAGGPLTMPRGTPLTLPLNTRFTTDQSTTLRLLFEPGASLSHNADCRWFFLPFFEAMVQ